MDRTNSKFYVDMLNKIAEQQDEMTSCVKDLDKKLDLHIQRTEFKLKEVNEVDLEQNKILAEHAKKSTIIERSCENNKKSLEIRLEQLERAPRFIKTLLSISLKISTGLIAVSGTIYSIGKLFGYF